MDESIKIAWQIAQEWGAYGILFLLAGGLWWKLEKRDKQVYELVGIIKENTSNQNQIIERLKELNENLIKLLIQK